MIRATRIIIMSGMAVLVVALGWQAPAATTPEPVAMVAAKHRPWQHAMASSYGPGLFGNRTACGQTLTSRTIGVAHKTLPCGTRLRFRGRYGRRWFRTTVVDRGPYVSGRQFDLTSALVRRLGYGTVWQFGVRRVTWQKG